MNSLRLWKERPGPRPHDCRIAAVDEAVDVHVGTEVCCIRRLTGTIACLQRVARVHKGVAIGVTDENAHWDSNIAGVSAIAHIIKGKRDPLSVGHTSEIDGDLRSARAEAADAPDTRGYCRAIGRDWGREVNDHLICRAVAAFDSHVAQ